ncbi:conserved hypothetical protein [Culex quinquefasciatus]|uniref:Condensin complex subunit 1 N-terminal domain-containing protein n=1 Tax=Culex quinquefasciatus TaxID=7176 RepID=B0XJE0_CULQU|nr:conserved hypothetical protein [Culex quinquefasciatus]|eukprot:XP_001869762.1 conserved hypothetical protein [Culex quinquefasciatus]
MRTSCGPIAGADCGQNADVLARRSRESHRSSRHGPRWRVDEEGWRRKDNDQVEVVDWDNKWNQCIVQLWNLFQLPLKKLWDPPVCEESFVVVICDICYRTLEQSYVKNCVFQILGTAIKCYNLTLSFPVRILQNLEHCEASIAPIAGGVMLLYEEFGFASIYPVLIKDRAARLRDELLNLKSEVVRNCVLHITGETIVTELTSEELVDELKETRDDFLHDLFNHTMDVSVHVLERSVERLEEQDAALKKTEGDWEDLTVQMYPVLAEVLAVESSSRSGAVLRLIQLALRVPKLQDMLMSKSQTDMYEAIDIFTSDYLFGIKGTESGKQQNEQFQCRANELYDALTRHDMVTAFTRDHVKLDLFKDKFVLFSSNLTGKYEKIVLNKKIVQNWQLLYLFFKVTQAPALEMRMQLPSEGSCYFPVPWPGTSLTTGEHDRFNKRWQLKQLVVDVLIGRRRQHQVRFKKSETA